MIYLQRITQNFLPMIYNAVLSSFALFLLLSLIFNNSNDPSFHVATNLPVINPIGHFGSYTSDLLLQFFGLGAYLGTAMIFLRSFIFFKTVKRFSFTGLSLILVILTLICSILSVFSTPANWSYSTYGGLLGLIMRSFLTSFFGNFHVIVAIVLMTFSAFVLSLLDFETPKEILANKIHFLKKKLNFLRMERKFVQFQPQERQLKHSKYSLMQLIKALLSLFKKKDSIGLDSRHMPDKISGSGFSSISIDNNKMNIPESSMTGQQDLQRIDQQFRGQISHQVQQVQQDEGQQRQYELPNMNINASPVLSDRSLMKAEMTMNESKNPNNVYKERDYKNYTCPNLALLQDVALKKIPIDFRAAKLMAEELMKVLEDFSVYGKIVNYSVGPVITLYEFEPLAGTKSSRVIGLSDDIARSLKAVSARISVIPGKNALGIELPNAHREIVLLKEILASEAYQNTDLNLPVALGKNIGGEPIVVDLTKMPHLLVAGTTGSGKSVAINVMILSILFKLKPDECKFIMIDPKMLELSVYNGIPHLLTPVVTDPKKAVLVLKWVVKEMESRYKMMSYLGVRNIKGYNDKINEALKFGHDLSKIINIGFDKKTGSAVTETIHIEKKRYPYIVVIVDEMADLMLVAGKDIEFYIQRLAQMARAAGIHIIMATQRPSVDVITGVIKANLPTRISFSVTSKIDSRTILGEQGAEQLLGMGDMLYMPSGSKMIRVHGPFVSDKTVENIVSYLHSFGPPNYMDEINQQIEIDTSNDKSFSGPGSRSGKDDFNFDDSGPEEREENYYKQALEIVFKERKVSISYIQRQLRIGFNKAASLVDRMEREGKVTPANHQGKRDIIESAYSEVSPDNEAE